MKKFLQLTGLIALCIYAAHENSLAQLSFYNANSRLSNSNVRSGCAVTVVDVNNDGLDDILRLDDGHFLNLELQQRDGDFDNYFLVDIGVDIGGGTAWSMNAADVDHNGWKDVVADGLYGIRLVKIFESLGTISVTNTLLASSGFFLQNSTFADFNNDGWIDLFCCDDNAASKMYLNDGAGNLNISTFVNFAVNPGIFYGNDPADSGNYGSAWIDFDNDGDLDLFIAHCRQSSFSPSDLRRKDRLFVNDGSNNFTDMSDTYGIEPVDYWQTWTGSFGDIDNDADLDLVLTNHDHVSQIFENDGTGHYTELTSTGFHTNFIVPIESVVEDFDNDGFADILVTGTEWMFWRNNGNKTFTLTPGLFANNGMLSFATGDLNHDGFIDIYASYGDTYNNPSPTYDDILYLNNGNTNNFITINLTGTTSNASAIGARATLYGAWGAQLREVRAGESYGTCNSFQLHFGVGQATTIDSVVVWFPSGITTTIVNPAVNQFVNVVEGSCSLTGNVLPGPYIMCTGQTINISAAPGFNAYSWSNGATTQSITVSTAGTYNVMVTDAGGCTVISPTVEVLMNPDETPVIASTGELEFCQGGSVTLTSSPAASYLWSDGSTTQSITINASGTYVVTIQGVCAPFTSDPTTINVLPAPPPVTTGASGPWGSSLTLSATGNNLSWYDQQFGGTLLGTGPTYNTPVLNITTTYWVEDATEYAGDIGYIGPTYHQGTSYSGNNTNGSIRFSVQSPATLVSVKVYTDTIGDREIQLRDAGGAVLNSLLVNIPMDSSRVTLNFPMVPGNDYELTTNPAVNFTSLGTLTPRLQRSSQGVGYPYTLNNIVALTGSNQGSQFYYYFYDWEVQEPDFFCISERVPAIADIIVGLHTVEDANGFMLYPNPSSGLVTLELQSASNEPYIIILTDLSGRVVKQFDQQSASRLSLNLTNIAKGTYLVRVQSQDWESVRKITLN